MKQADLKLLFNSLGLALALGLCLGFCCSPASDGDIWRHLAGGQRLLQENGFPEKDPFLFSLSNPSWDRHEWLFSLLAYGLFQAGGVGALAVFKLTCLLLAFAFCFGTAFRRGSRPFSALLFACWALFASRFSFDNHLQCLNLALFSAALFFMEGPFWSAFFSRWIWLPLMTAVWTNLSGQAFFVIPTAGLWLLAERGEPGEARPGASGILKGFYLVALLASFLLTPLGLNFFARCFSSPSLLLPDGNWLQGLAALDALQPALWLLLLLVVLLISNGWINEGRPHLVRDVLLLAFWSGLGFFHAKFFPYFCLWAAPVAASRLDTLVDALPALLQQGRWLLKLGLVAAGLMVLPRVYQKPFFGLLPPTNPFPEETVRFLKEQGPEEKIFCPREWGGFLEWELKGKEAVFADGRSLPASLERMSRELDQAEPSWRKILDQQGVEMALVDVDSPLSKTLAYAFDWQPLSFDNVSVLYVKNTPAHQNLIHTYAPRGLRPGDPQQPVDPHRPEQSEADLEGRLAQFPHLGRLYYYQAALYQAEGKPEMQMQSLKKGIQMDPSFPENYNWLGGLMAEKGFVQEAKSLYLKSLSLRWNPRVQRWLMQLKASY